MTALDHLRDAWHHAELIWQDGAGDTASAQAPGHTPADRSVSFRYDGEKILMNCHAGEDKADVLREVGLDMSALREYADYKYQDGRIKHRRPGKNIWVTGNKQGTALYRAETLAQHPEAQVYVTDGEKDVDALETVGATAVTCGSLGSARKFDWTPLTGRDVTIVADTGDKNDIGLKHAAQVAQILDGHARSVTVVTAKTGSDAADHVAAGHGLGDFQPIEIAPAGRRLKVTVGTDVKARRVEWLIPDWIPRSALTLLAGREGLGKSTIAVAWAAEQTRQGHAILYVHTEDSREHTVAPRLKAAGADMAKVLFVDVETETSSTGTVTLPFDNHDLERIIEKHRVGFMVLDAATSSMSSELSGKDDRQVRQFLEPLAQMAARQNMVVLGLVHFGKRDGADSGKLILGSIAWSQVARSVLSVAYDDEDEHLVLTNTKGNLATRVRSEALRIASRTVDTEDGPTEVGSIEWLGETNSDARDLLAGDQDSTDDRSEVEAVVTDYLASQGGSAPAGDVLKATRAAGLSDNAVKKSRKKIGITTRKAGGSGVGWVWTLDAPKVPAGAEDSKVPPIGGVETESLMTSKDAKGAHTREWESLAPLGESSTPSAPVQLPTEARSEARESVLGSLSASFGMHSNVVAQSVPKPHRDQTENILAALVADGTVTVDSAGKYLKNGEEAA